MPSRALEMWTVYDHPTDYPDGFIARLHLAYDGFAVSTPNTFTGLTLDAVRDQLPRGLHRIVRSPDDDPKIVETWI